MQFLFWVLIERIYSAKTILIQNHLRPLDWMYWRLRTPEEKTQTTQTGQRVALAPFSRELLPQPLWRCQKELPIYFSDHKASAAAVRRRRKRLVAAGDSPRLRCLCFFPKVSKSESQKLLNLRAEKKNTRIYTNQKSIVFVFSSVASVLIVPTLVPQHCRVAL